MTAGADAVASFTTNYHDFGTVKEERGSVSHEFEFTNTGDTPLLIVNAVASCGCTRPQFDTKPIKPGKTGKIKVTYSTVGRPGAFSKTVRVQTNAKGNTKTVVLLIEGTVTPKSQR